jgi:putative nucleotidyltransferase with HDIG domain
MFSITLPRASAASACRGAVAPHFALMTLTSTLIPVADRAPVARPALRGESGVLARALEQLEAAFAQPFLLLDADTGEQHNTLAVSHGWDFHSRLAVLGESARRGRPEIVEQESPLMMLAVPLTALERGASLVAVTVLLSMPVDRTDEMASAARVFGVDVERALAWACNAEVWSARGALKLAEATLDNIGHRAHLDFAKHEADEAVAHARDTYAELGLLHRLTRRLSLSDDDGQLWRRSVQWLAEHVPAQCLAIVPQQETACRDELADGNDVPPLPLPTAVVHGHCPVELSELEILVSRLAPAHKRPLLLNRFHTSSLTWTFPTIRELACTPIACGTHAVGWLLAINHTGVGVGVSEFGSAEIRLLESVSTILGVHRSNTQLLHRQADLFAASVRALISAIDAKDRYTHGHSERVAQVAKCLAEKLHLPKCDVNTIYLGGLLHDIGKIGVDDVVLNKPGALTPEEYDQIKQHPQLGFDILRGVRQLERILPIVLYHHEAWDGSGYPHGLKGEETPLLARITAVADAFDAMSSDRPYRRGMPDEKLDAILREGAGRQWDPHVVEAFFASRDEIRDASRNAELEAVPLNAASWVS